MRVRITKEATLALFNWCELNKIEMLFNPDRWIFKFRRRSVDFDPKSGRLWLQRDGKPKIVLCKNHLIRELSKNFSLKNVRRLEYNKIKFGVKSS